MGEFDDIYSRDIEFYLNTVEVQDRYHAHLLRISHDERRFSEYSDASNTAYAFMLASWVRDHFEYLSVAGSEDFSSKDLPDAIKLLIARTWAPRGQEPETIYPEPAKLRLSTHTETVMPTSDNSYAMRLVDELRDSGRSFSEMITDLKALVEVDDELGRELNRARRPLAELETIVVNWVHPGDSSTGLEFHLTPTHVTVNPYGKPELTPGLNNFFLTYHDKPRELAHITSDLTVLAAENCLARTRQYTTSREDIDDFLKALKTI